MKSQRRESDPRPHSYQECALPTELRRQNNAVGILLLTCTSIILPTGLPDYYVSGGISHVPSALDVLATSAPQITSYLGAFLGPAQAGSMCSIQNDNRCAEDRIRTYVAVRHLIYGQARLTTPKPQLCINLCWSNSMSDSIVSNNRLSE